MMAQYVLTHALTVLSYYFSVIYPITFALLLILLLKVTIMTDIFS